MSNRRILCSQSVTLIRKKSNMKEKKYQRTTNVDDSEFCNFNEEISQTPEYLRAVEQFLERRSCLIQKVKNEDLTKINSEEECEKDDIKHNIKNTKNIDSNKIIGKINDSNENKNTSSSVNYEKFQSGNINDSRKNILPHTTTTITTTSSEISPEIKNHNNNLRKDNKIKLTNEVNDEEELVIRNVNLKLHKTEQELEESINNDDDKYQLSKKQRDQINGFIRNISGESSSNEENKNVNKSPSNNKNSYHSPIKTHGKEFCSYVPYIPLNELKEFKPMEYANFGWYCEWRESKWNDLKVNVRTIKPHCKKKSINLLTDEINALSTLRHSNILILMGFTLDTLNNVLPIYEFFHHSLYTHLHEMSHALSVRQISQLIIQTLEAISYAHQMDIIHTTLSSHCIMFQHIGQIVKICGFDYSAVKNQIVENNIGRNQWYQWLAPELLQSNNNIKAMPTLDIYSICTILWECCYLTVPWTKISSSQLSQIYSKWKMSLSISEDFLSTKIYNILKEGLEINPNKRISSTNELLRRIKYIKRQMTSENDFFLFTSAKINLSQTSPQKVIVKKYNIFEPETKPSSSSTTPSPKSTSTSRSPNNHSDTTPSKHHNQLITNTDHELQVVNEEPQFCEIKKTLKFKDAISLGNYNVKDVIAEHEKIILELRESLNYVHIDQNKIFVSDTRIKPASHRTAIIKIPITGLNEIPIPNKPDRQISTEEPFEKVKIKELKSFFENYYWSEEQIKCLSKLQCNLPESTTFEHIIQLNEFTKSLNIKQSECLNNCSKNEETETIKFIKDLILSIINTECFKSEQTKTNHIETNEHINIHTTEITKTLNNGNILYKGYLNLGKNYIDFYPFIFGEDEESRTEDKKCLIEKTDYELEQISVQTLQKFQQLYNYCNCLLSKVKEITSRQERLLVNECLRDEATRPVQISSTDETNEISSSILKLYFVPESMNYWNAMLKIFTNLQLEDAYIDEDFTSENLQLIPYEESMKNIFCDDTI